MSTYSREISVAGVLGALLLALAVFSPHFYQWQPMVSRFTSQMPILVVAVGVAMVIMTRQIDISVGSQFSMCAVIAGVTAAAGFPLPIAVGSAVVSGIVMGAINGALIVYLGLPSIVVTLATMVTWQEVIRLWQQGRLLPLPEGFQWFGLSQSNGQLLVICCGLVLLAIAAWALKNLSVGRFIYAAGSDAEAARLAGIQPKKTTFGVFVMMGALAGIGAVINLVQSPQVQPNCGDGLELKAIAAAVVGGVAITGGRGNLWGVLLGVLLLTNVNPALTHFSQPAYWEKAIQGLVILFAVAADVVRKRPGKLIARVS